jgi:hypothetical protein
MGWLELGASMVRAPNIYRRKIFKESSRLARQSEQLPCLIRSIPM